MGNNTRFGGEGGTYGGGLIIEGGIYAAGTTVFKTGAGGAATNLPTGQLKARSVLSLGGISAAGTLSLGGAFTTTGVVTSGGVSAAGTLRAAGGFGFVAGNYKKFACGTYIGSGGATAVIISTGLTTITQVWMQRLSHTYATATTNGVYSPRPCRAHGTLGSFYPIIIRSAGAAGAPTLGLSAGATHSWLAIGT